jgi:hypothetical protein
MPGLYVNLAGDVFQNYGHTQNQVPMIKSAFFKKPGENLVICSALENMYLLI